MFLFATFIIALAFIFKKTHTNKDKKFDKFQTITDRELPCSPVTKPSV
ncbi:hypothetical protein ACBQ97_19455 [Escherichia ruysiae]